MYGHQQIRQWIKLMRGRPCPCRRRAATLPLGAGRQQVATSRAQWWFGVTPALPAMLWSQCFGRNAFATMLGHKRPRKTSEGTPAPGTVTELAPPGLSRGSLVRRSSRPPSHGSCTCAHPCTMQCHSPLEKRPSMPRLVIESSVSAKIFSSRSRLMSVQPAMQRWSAVQCHLPPAWTNHSRHHPR